jgi:hypothetical protein
VNSNAVVLKKGFTTGSGNQLNKNLELIGYVEAKA